MTRSPGHPSSCPPSLLLGPQLQSGDIGSVELAFTECTFIKVTGWCMTYTVITAVTIEAPTGPLWACQSRGCRIRPVWRVGGVTDTQHRQFTPSPVCPAKADLWNSIALLAIEVDFLVLEYVQPLFCFLSAMTNASLNVPGWSWKSLLHKWKRWWGPHPWPPLYWWLLCGI